VKTATYVGDPANDGEGKPRLVMKKTHTFTEAGKKVLLFPLTGLVFPMNKPVEVTDAQHDFLKGHSHFEVSPSDGDEGTEDAEGPEGEGETGESDEA
jgi:hypothetical protein